MTRLLNFIRNLLGLIFTQLLGPARHRRQLGFAVVRFRALGINLEGDFKKMRITNTQEFDVKFVPRDIHLNATDEYEHGSELFGVKDGDASLVTIQVDPNNPLWATIRATGKNGIVQIFGSVDGDPGDGREIIEATLGLEIVSSRARSLELQPAAIREQVEETPAPPETGGAGSAPENDQPAGGTTETPDLGNPLATPTGGAGAPPAAEPPKTIEVDPSEASKFPLMGGAKVVDDVNTLTEQE